MKILTVISVMFLTMSMILLVMAMVVFDGDGDSCDEFDSCADGSGDGDLGHGPNDVSRGDDDRDCEDGLNCDSECDHLSLVSVQHRVTKQARKHAARPCTQDRMQ